LEKASALSENRTGRNARPVDTVASASRETCAPFAAQRVPFAIYAHPSVSIDSRLASTNEESPDEPAEPISSRLEEGRMSNYTKRIGARAQLAAALKLDLPRALAAGVREDELDIIAQRGEEARAADAAQTAERAEKDSAFSDRSASTGAVIERGDALRDRLPAAVASLERAGHAGDSKFLAAVSYARFRVRGLIIDPALANDPDVKRLERTEREDKVSVLEGIANLTSALLTRENIVTDLTARGLDRAALERLRDDANAEARAGKNILGAADATKRESDAVKAQKAVWNVTWRMIRKAVQGDEALEKLYAQC
jgi:hypothetical protein